MGKLEKKVAVITGAASGIGRATAIRFAGEGAAVVIADLNREGGESAVRDCKENGGSAVFQLTDVSSEENIKGAVDRAVKEFGRLDVIYNNAGLGGAVGTAREDQCGKLGSQLLGSAACGIPRDQARGSRNAQDRRRVHHLDRLDRRTARRTPACTHTVRQRLE